MRPSVEDARRLVLGHVTALPSEQVELAGAHLRTLAEDILARVDLPPAPVSAMDGYAMRATCTGPGVRLPVTIESRAGAPAREPLGAGEAARISTGAVVPAGADAVVRREDVEELDGAIVLQRAAPAGQDVRLTGEALRAGERALLAGATLDAGALAVLAAAGHDVVTVRRRPRVAIVTTGDEVVAPGEDLAPGQVHDSNGIAVGAQVVDAGAIVSSRRHAGDTPDSVRATLVAAMDSDVVVITGGVSVGEHDHVRPQLTHLGVTALCEGVALRPGGPTWIGRRTGDDHCAQLVFALPGNPVSAMVCFELFVRPALRVLLGDSRPLRMQLPVRLGAPASAPGGKTHVVRCTLESGPDALVATPLAHQGSHIVGSMAAADALVFVEPGVTLDAGDAATAELLRVPGATRDDR